MAKKILNLIDRRERWKLALVLFLAILSGLAQVVGVGSVLPFVGVLTNPDVVTEGGILGRVYEIVGSPGVRNFLVLLGATVLAAFVLSNSLIAFTLWFTFRFARWNQYRLSSRLLEAYLSRPYVYHLQHNSAEAGTKILAEAQNFTDQVLIPALQAVAFGVAVIYIGIFLIWLDPMIAAVGIGVISGAYALVYVSLRWRLYRVGESRLQANMAQYKAATEAFGAIKEIKVTGREAAFLDRYDPEARRFAHSQAVQQMLSNLPRYLIEVVGMVTVLLVVLFLVASGREVSVIVPLVSVYAIASFRLFPALQRVYLGVSLVRASIPMLHALHADLTNIDDGYHEVMDHPVKLTFERSIELRDVTFTYPDQTTPAVSKVTLTIPRGSSVAFVGETGAGKTTLVDILLGLLPPTEGQVQVDSVPLDDENSRSWRANIGYVPQHIYLADDTIAANIGFGISADRLDREAVERAARVASIHDFIVERLPQRYETLVGERGIRLSGGQRQRIGIARALYHDPEVLMLDEATSALDSSTEGAVLDAIHRNAATRTIIVIAHRLTTVQKSDIVYVLDQGRVVAHGSYEQLIAESPRFRSLSRAGLSSGS